jgi:hypothetical protein
LGETSSLRPVCRKPHRRSEGDPTMAVQIDTDLEQQAINTIRMLSVDAVQQA